MGEAKRRRLRRAAIVHGSPVEYLAPDGTTQTARQAPAVLNLYRQHDAMLRRVEAGDRAAAAKVPCDGCTACCHFKHIEVCPEQELVEDLRQLDLVDDPEKPGQKLIRKRQDGACIHLGPWGCTVYQHRPRACRIFDCRIRGVAGIRERFGGEVGTDDSPHLSPGWIPEMRTPLEAALAQAMSLTAAQSLAQDPDTETAFQRAMLALVQMVRFFPRFQAEIRALSPEQKEQLGAAAREQQMRMFEGFARLQAKRPA